MKKRAAILVFAITLLALSFVQSEGCELGVTLVNQDPYPAVPNDYLDLVFQVSGVQNSYCNNMVFEVLEKFPFTVQGEAKQTLKRNTYIYDTFTDWMVSYTINVDKDALDGDSELTVRYYQEGSDIQLTKKFEIPVEDSLADFEIHVKDYSYLTEELNIEILNIAESDVEALTVEIPKQNNVQIKGSNRVVVGDLDSNEYTSAEFTAIPKNGEITLDIYYTDQIGVRRHIQKSVNFDSDYFEETTNQKKSSWYYIIVLVIIAAAVWWFLRKRKKKKEKIMHRRGMAEL